jgi:hypothetical protein
MASEGLDFVSKIMGAYIQKAVPVITILMIWAMYAKGICDGSGPNDLLYNSEGG